MKEKTVPTTTDHAAQDTRESSRSLIPPVDIFETAAGLAVVADMPGVGRDDVNIDVTDNVLTLRATPKPLMAGEPAMREYQLYPYFRQFELSDAVDQEGIRAEMKYGVLTIHLPKQAAKQPRKIEVQVAS